MSNAPAENQKPEIVKGMKGVVIDESKICDIDGDAGKLIYRGYKIEDLADNASYEETAYLLLKGKLPNRAELDDYIQKIGRERELPDIVMSVLRGFPKNANPMAVLRTAVSAYSETDAEAEDDSEEANQRKAIRLMGVMPVMMATHIRLRQGKEPVKPKKDVDLATNLLWCLNGEMPTEAMVRATDLYLVLLAEHGMNASTFASLVTAGTQSDFYSCVVSAIGALKGPLHGGANRAAMEMIEKLESPEQARKITKEMLDKKERVPGFGHRVYRTKDPRGTSLHKAAVKLLQEAGQQNLLDICHAIEEVVQKEKGLDYNVDFYSAPVLRTLGFPTDSFVDLFAVSRISGWAAHIIEFKSAPALLRPRILYTGPRDLAWKPIDERS